MEELERRKSDVLPRMAQTPEDVPAVHPNIAEIYKAKVNQLSEALTGSGLREQAAEAVRAPVDEVVLEPGDKRGEVNAILRSEAMSTSIRCAELLCLVAAFVPAQPNMVRVAAMAHSYVQNLLGRS